MRALVKSVVPVAVRGSPWGSVVRTPSIMQETWQELWVQSLGQEDPLEEEMATLSSILTWNKRKLVGNSSRVTKNWTGFSD